MVMLIVPEVVIVPPVNPVPVATLVTVPFPLPVPAPIAVRNVAASSADTVLSAFMRGKVTALGLVSVKKLLPTVVAPRPVRAPLAVVEPVPPLAIGSVPVTCVVRLTLESVPPSVRLPLDVTVPESVMPLTEPVPPTLVTVPLPVPAPIAERKVAASSAETVLLAFTRRNVIALGFVSVKSDAPTVVAPRLVLASVAVPAPVPPFATARVPPSVRVPDEVIGPPEAVRPLVPPEILTLVTLPTPAPIALRNVAASRADTVLSALIRGKAIAFGLAKVKKFDPTLVAPKLLRAPEADVDPVPPLAIANVPAIVIVPLFVIGPLLKLRPVVPPDTSILVTVPAPRDTQDRVPEPLVLST